MLKFPKKNQGVNRKKQKEHAGNFKKNRKRKRERSKKEGKPTKGRKKTKSYKSRIRDLERMLRKKTLKDEIRVAKTKQLQQLKRDKNSHQAEVANNHRALRHKTKYGQARFVDKRKLLRKLNQTNKKLASASTDEETSTLTANLEEFQSDLKYIENFPRHLKYISVVMAKKKNDPKQLKQIAEVKEFIAKNEPKQAPSKVETVESESESESEDPELKKKMAAIASKLGHDAVESESENENEETEDNIKQANAEDFTDSFLEFATEDLENDALLEFEKSDELEKDPLLEFADEPTETEGSQKPKRKLTRKERKKLGIMNARKKKKLQD